MPIYATEVGQKVVSCLFFFCFFGRIHTVRGPPNPASLTPSCSLPGCAPGTAAGPHTRGADS